MNIKQIAVILLIVFSAVAARAGGVTNIKEVVNETGREIEVRKYDTQPLAAGVSFETTRGIPADGGTWSGDMWIPWADNAEDFADKRLEILIDGRPIFWIWQTGEFVRYHTRNRYIPNAPRVNGEAKSGGERRLLVRMDGKRYVFEFERL